MLGDLEGAVVVGADDEEIAVLEVLGQEHGRTRLRITHSTRPRSREVELPSTHELGQVALAELRSRPTHAGRLAAGEVTVRKRADVLRARVAVGVLTTAAAVWLLAANVLPSVQAFGASLMFLLAVVAFFTRSRFDSVRSYVVDGVVHDLGSLFGSAPAPAAAVSMVADVKAEYGRLLSDIVTRIEHPALFDPAVPQTRALTSALIRWDTNHQHMEPVDVGRLASEVRVAFDVARGHAEQVGLDHIPEQHRATAGRALGAARLARSGATPDERRSALEHALRMLRDMSLYYLPDPTEARLMVEGRTIRALPGVMAAEEE